MKLVRQTVLLQRVSGCGSCERKDASSPDTKVKEASVVANPNFSRFSRYCEANISRICSPPYRLTRRMIKTITFEIPLSRHEIVRVKNSNANPRKSCSRRFSRDAAFQLQSPVLWPDRKLKLGRASDRTERWKKNGATSDRELLRNFESYLQPKGTFLFRDSSTAVKRRADIFHYHCHRGPIALADRRRRAIGSKSNERVVVGKDAAQVASVNRASNDIYLGPPAGTKYDAEIYRVYRYN